MTEQQILLTLDKLNIQRENSFKGKYINILCPSHNDKSFGSCQVYSNSVIKCWSCGYVSNLFSLVRSRKPELTSKQIFEFLGETNYLSPLSIYLQERKQIGIRNTKEIYIPVEKVKALRKEKVNPLELYYSFSRMFNKSFIERFEVEIISEGYYKDFFCIPIKYKGEIISYEFRKAKEFEYFEKYYGNSEKSLESFRKQFKEDLKNGIVEKNFITNYLRKSKVIYNKNAKQLKSIIFNIDNLNFNEDIYITEGVAGIPEIEFNFNTRNVTALFGSNISEEQISILSRFKKRKILILDNDIASEKLMILLNDLISNFWIVNQNNQTIKTSDYLLDKSGFLKDFHIL